MRDPSLDIELEHRLEQFRAAPDSRAFAPLADCYRRLRQYDDARRVCEAGLESHPTYVTAYVILARIHYEQGHVTRAKSAFEKVLELDPHNLTAMRFLATAAEQRGDDRAAMEYWRQVETFDPHDGAARARRQRLEANVKAEVPLALERSLDGIDDEEEGAREADAAAVPDRPPAVAAAGGQIATITLADIYYEQGFKAKALEIYRSVQRESPGTAGVEERVAEIERELSHLKQRLEATHGGDPLDETLASLSSPPHVDGVPAQAKPPPTPPERRGPGPEADVDDFEQFRTWLGRIKARPF